MEKILFPCYIALNPNIVLGCGKMLSQSLGSLMTLVLLSNLSVAILTIDKATLCCGYGLHNDMTQVERAFMCGGILMVSLCAAVLS